jgi:hypothetical protein
MGKKKKINTKQQLPLFEIQDTSGNKVAVSSVETTGKIVSIGEFKHKQDVKKFYELANQLTSHLK